MIRKASATESPEPAWFKSSYSDGPDGNSCLEVALTPTTIHVRDSKTPEGPRLTLSPAAWTDFLASTATGRN